MIHRSSRASPGGSSALRTRCTRRSLLVTVPSLSAHAAAAGNTTSAISAVAVMKMSWTIEQVEAAQAALGEVAVGLGLERVLADDVERGELAAVHRLEHARQVPATLGRDAPLPDALALLAELVVLDELEAGQPVGQRAHVAAALDVVLAAQRVEPAPVPPDVPRQQRERDRARGRCRPRCGAR